MTTPICPLLTKLPEKVYTWNMSLVETAHAQNNISQSINNFSYQTGAILTLPFYFLIMMFFLFVVVMSVVYVYHWENFNLGDSFIKNYMYVYFIGLVVLCVPLLYLLLS